MRASIRTLVKSDSGVTALEYALILALVAVVIISAIFGLGDKVGQNFDIIVAAVSDRPVPGDDPGAPGGGGATGDDQSRQAPTPAPVADASARDDGGGNTGGGPVAAAAEAGPAESLSGGENIGPDAGAENPSHRALALSGEGAGAGAGGGGFSGVGGTGGTGRSQGGGTGDTGIVKTSAGRGGEPGPAGTREAGALPGRDATSDWFWNATPSWDQSAALAPSAMAAPGGDDRSTGRADRAGEGSDLTSILALLLGLILALLMAILGWKKALRTAAEKGGDEQSEGWEPLSFGQSNDPRPV